MGLLSYLTLFTAVATFILGFVVFFQSQRRALNGYFLVFALINTLWLVTNFYFQAIGQNLFILKSQYATGSLVLVSAFPWIFVFVKDKIEQRMVVLISILAGLFFVMPYIDGWLIQSISVNSDGTYGYITGPLFNYYSAVLFLLLCGIIYQVSSAYRESKGLKRAQARYLLIGISAFALASIIFSVILPLFNVKPVAPFDAQSSLIWVALTAYAIVAHQLFDIKVIIRRTVVYSGLLLFAVLVYSMIIFSFATLFGGDQNALSTKTFLVNLLAATIIAAGFEPLRRLLVRLTDEYLFVGTYNAQTVIAQLAQTLSSVLDLDEALQSMMHVLGSALRIDKLATFIIASHQEEDASPVKRIQSMGYTPTEQAQLNLDKNGPLLSYFVDPGHRYVVLDELLMAQESRSNKTNLQPIIDKLNKLGGAAALPVRVKDKLIGILIVGPKLSGDVFTKEDIQFLDIAANQTAAAIEKSRFYEDDQLKSEFVSIASHELLTPTAAIEGYLSMVLDEKMGVVDPKAEEYLRKVQSSAHRLAELVTDLLSVSRIEGGRIVINKQPIEVSPVINRVIDEIGVKATQAEIALKYLAPDKPLPKVLADPERVVQVVTNLISNSIKYNKPKGSITVTAEADDNFVTIHVSDTGIGIAPAHLPHLFEKFYRVHDDSAASEKIGTGLGLYITRSIVELQGGTIKVESEAGKGSVFSFTIPVA